MRKEEGSALISVILVVLVLTMVGVASLFFMTTEERISNVARMEKAAFYCAEVGLREAERNLVEGYDSNTAYLSTTLSTTQTAFNTFEVPGGGYDGIVLADANILDHNDPALAIIDSESGGIAVPAGEMRGIQVDDANGYVSTYSVYVRNNPEDPNPVLDGDNKINVVSVGLVVTPMRQVIRKVLEEQISPGSSGGLGTGQKGINMSSTGSVGYGESN